MENVNVTTENENKLGGSKVWTWITKLLGIVKFLVLLPVTMTWWILKKVWKILKGFRGSKATETISQEKEVDTTGELKAVLRGGYKVLKATEQENSKQTAELRAKKAELDAQLAQSEQEGKEIAAKIEFLINVGKHLKSTKKSTVEAQDAKPQENVQTQGAKLEEPVQGIQAIRL